MATQLIASVYSLTFNTKYIFKIRTNKTIKKREEGDKEI